MKLMPEDDLNVISKATVVLLTSYLENRRQPALTNLTEAQSNLEGALLHMPVF